MSLMLPKVCSERTCAVGIGLAYPKIWPFFIYIGDLVRFPNSSNRGKFIEESTIPGQRKGSDLAFSGGEYSSRNVFGGKLNRGKSISPFGSQQGS